jgi:hypothetical protein
LTLAFSLLRFLGFGFFRFGKDLILNWKYFANHFSLQVPFRPVAPPLKAGGFTQICPPPPAAASI